MTERWIALDGVTVDFEARVVRGPKGDVTLAPLEVKLLRFLVDQRGRAVSRGELLREVWGYRTLQSRTLATTVRRLREKVEANPNVPVHVRTVPGGGYRFEGPRVVASFAPASRVGRFVGREDARVEVERASDHRVVTITGPAGVGKSRLAVEVASAWRDRRVVSVGLLGGTGSREVIERIGAALGAAVVHDPAELAQVLHRAGPLTVVLDDADEAVATVAGLLPQMPPAVRFLVTSREALAIGLERVVALDGLPGPVAAQLFADRAGVEPSPRVEELCARLDGLPLAIELAAGWVPTLSVEEILLRIESVSWLSGTRRDQSTRHGSLSTAIEASLLLLDEQERQVLRAIAAFALPMTLAALEAVAGPAAADGVRNLAARSLIRLDEGLIRPYRVVAAHVAEAREGVAVERAHGVYFARFGTPDELGAVERGDRVRTEAVGRVREELALAAERAARRGDSVVAVPCAQALAVVTALAGGGQDRLAQVLESVIASVDDDETRAGLLANLAVVRRRQGRHADAERAIDRGFAAVREGPSVARGRLLRIKGQLQLGRGEAEAEKTFTEGIRHAELAGDEVTAALVRGHLGFLYGSERRDAEAEGLLKAALHRMRALGHHRHEASLLSNLAQVVQNRGGDPMPLFREAAATHRRIGARHAEALLRIAWGDALAERGDLAGAHREYGRAHAALVDMACPWIAARAAVNDACVWVQEGEDDHAWEILTDVLPVVESAADRPFLAVIRANLALVCLARGEPELAALELDRAHAALGDRGNPQVRQFVAVARRLLSPAPPIDPLDVEGPDPRLAALARLVSAEAPPEDPAWVSLTRSTDSVGRLARIAITQLRG